MKPIKVWRFENAPEEYKKLSTNGGDEDWLAFVPSEYVDPNGCNWISWLEGNSFDTCSEPQQIKVTGGTIWIGSHA